MWPAPLLIAGAVAVFANSLTVPFVFDDQRAIVDNASIRRLWPPPTALAAPPQSPVAGRPIVNLSLAVNYAIGGLDPWGYHAANLGVHLLAALTLFGVVRRTLASEALANRFATAATPLAFAAALIWLTHPLQTEIVDYAAQRTESMAGLFYLLTLYAAIRAMSPPLGRHQPRWSIAAVVACGLGMASKESVVTAPLMVLLYDAVFVERGIRDAVRRRPRFYAALFATWIILAALLASGPRSHSAGFSAGVAPRVYLLDQAPMIAAYLKLAFWPHPLVLDYGMPAAIGLTAALPPAILVLALIAATVVAWRYSRAAAFLGAWFSLGATCVMLATLTVQRNAEYRDPIALWQTVVDRRPGGRAHYNLGIELKAAGRRDEAIDHYRQALADDPEAHYALGFEAEADGRYDEAIAHYREYIRLRPEDVNVIRACTLLGRALAVRGRLDEAVDAFRQALRMQPSNADARGGLADALSRQQRFDEAIPEYQRYLRLQPASAGAHENL
ncbi:MAG: tetratricopeptide repeat protein, partial [Acidobacteria bacterium]|nr:tetratricopeptide repeat protein [Acidobacteriota bacterium]